MIPRREFLSCGLAAATAASALQTAGEGRFNVLFVAVDDLRPELGCYGNNLIRTPNVDRLAQRGLLFRRAYCQAAVCGPSRASLPTGLRPDTTRVWGNRTHFRKTLPDLVTLPQAFKGAGYHAEAIGKVLHGNTADPPSWGVPAWPPGGRQAGMQYVDEDAFREMRAAEPKRAWRGEKSPRSDGRSSTHVRHWTCLTTLFKTARWRTGPWRRCAGCGTGASSWPWAFRTVAQMNRRFRACSAPHRHAPARRAVTSCVRPTRHFRASLPASMEDRCRAIPRIPGARGCEVARRIRQANRCVPKRTGS